MVNVPTNYIVTACVSDKRWFDLDAERTPTDRYDLGGNGGREHAGGRSGGDMRGGPHNSGSNPAGAPPLDCWVDDTAETVARRLINLMCPREVCTVCGEPRRRIVGEPEYVTANGDTSDGDAEWRHGRGGDVHGLGSTAPQSLTRHAPTLGWTDCGCKITETATQDLKLQSPVAMPSGPRETRDPRDHRHNYRPGVVLDPFANCEETPMSHCSWRHGDVFDRLAEIPDNSVDLIVTSPPFLALRSYLPADHPDKGKEIGSEATPAAFLSTLLALTREWRRILAPHGSIAVELGDTYSGSGGAGGDYDTGGIRDGAPKFSGSASADRKNKVLNDKGQRMQQGQGWPLAKSLCLIPSLYAGSLAYGHNLLNPADRIKPWRVRNVIVWHRPNPPVGALGDKVRPSTSYITVACVSDKRWFDLDAERTPYKEPDRIGTLLGHKKEPEYQGRASDGNTQSTWLNRPGRIIEDRGGAPPLDCWIDGDVWTIPTAPYKGAHYATYPIALPRRLINLMCPREVCVVCGEPRRRIVQVDGYVDNSGKPAAMDMNRPRVVDQRTRQFTPAGQDSSAHKLTTTLGWTDCQHNKWRRGLVLDPFAGSGTTLAAAAEQGRDAIGIDLDERNLDLARERLGLFLEDVT
jgi:site-specific DNA-methyltransferase (adenine-specific)